MTRPMWWRAFGVVVALTFGFYLGFLAGQNTISIRDVITDGTCICEAPSPETSDG